MITDKDRIDWLEKQAKDGCSPGLVNGDNGHWAVSMTGFQNAVCGRKAQDVQTTFCVAAKEWRRSVRAAIDAAMKASTKGGR